METAIRERFLEFIRENHLCSRGDRILLAISGGSDSMMLADLFCQTDFVIGVAHCNFQLRGADSVRDESFVRALSERYGVPFHVIRFETEEFARTRKLSTQEAARVLRYDWFEKVRQEFGYSAVATAHQLNDHVETLLINFFKGTGIQGMHGIPVKNGRVIRPMLFVTKKEVWQYIETRKIRYVEDITNESDKYTRNYLRHQVIPLLDQVFPAVEKRLERNMARFREVEQLYMEATDLHKKKLTETRGEEVYIPILKLKKSRPLSSIAYELFKTWNFSFEQSRQIISILDSDPGKMVASTTHRLIRDRDWLIISRLDSKDVSYVQIEASQSMVTTAGITLHLKEIAAGAHAISREQDVATLDAAKITYPLVLRKWKQGDYFYPLGMPKKKKLSRFFIDQKLPGHEKEKVWVLESGHRIIWVVGMRIDERFKIGPVTKTVLQISCRKLGS